MPAFLTPLDQKTIHFPVKNIGLTSDEYLFVIKGKMRPAIMLTDETTGWPTLPTEAVYLCLPIYRVDKPKIPQSFVLKAQALQYISKFYIPPSSGFALEEGVARFELIQPVHRYALSAFVKGGKPVMLSENFRYFFRLQLTEYLGGVLEKTDKDILKEYETSILDEARKQGVKV
jgi:hypothetical protein